VKWEGDIYDERCGEYRIRTQYTHRGAFSTLYHLGRIINYTIGPDEAKDKAEEHADRNGLVVADEDVSDEAQIELRAKVLASHK
jgi:hypothetical protein